MLRRCAATILLLTAGCTGQQTPAASPIVPTPPVLAPNPASPVQAQLDGPAQVADGQPAELVLHIDRITAAIAPLHVDLQLPSGVVLLSGKSSDVIDASEPLHLTRTWRVQVERVPAADIVAVLDWQTTAGGYHAALAYRFGRAAPQALKPTRFPHEIVLPGGRSLGQPILTGPVPTP